MSEPDGGQSPRRIRGRRGGWAFAVVLVVGLAGCTSGPGEATTLPTVVPSVSGSEGSPVPTVSPAESDEAQIEAAVREFVDAVNQVITTNDTDGYLAVTVKSCTCRAVARSARQREARGETVEGGVWTVRTIDSSAAASGGTAVATLHVREAAYVIRAASGALVDSGKSRVSSHVIFLVQDGGDCLVTDVDAA